MDSRSLKEISKAPLRRARAQGRRQMSAIIKFADHIPSRPTITEILQEEFANINSPDTPLEQKLASALSCIMQLQMRISDMQERIAQSQREVSIKETLLRNATQREIELRTQLVRRLW
jgi:hypothetical protein